MRGYRNRTTRRAAQRRDLLQPERGTDCHRAMAKALQHDQASLIARISTAGATDNEPVPDTARSGRTNAIVSLSRWYKISVRSLFAAVHESACGTKRTIAALQHFVRFSNRPFWVKRFQTMHHCSVDVARGLVLLFGIGTKALPSWDSKTRRNNLLGGLAVRRTTGPSGQTNS